MKIEFVDSHDNNDGGATFTFDLDNEALVVFAKIGLLTVLKEEANKVVEEHEKLLDD
jgi:hypothetical protein